MCFTPIVSLSTAIFEFAVATFILIHYRKSNISKAIIILIYCLGLYQFSEFMLCSSNNPVSWAKIGFIAYTFLPALGLKTFLKYTGKKQNDLLIFIIPVIYSIFAVTKANFILESSCEKYFIIVKNMFWASPNVIPMILYSCYYFGFIGYICYLIINHYATTQNKIKKLRDLFFFIGISISLIFALVLLFIFPALSISFPSVYCHFAIFFAVCTLIGFYLDNKINKKK
jgi:hypothetical protein